MPIVARARVDAMAMAPVIVAQYSRVSTLNQLDGFGLEDQDGICGRWLDSHPAATLFGKYTERAVSGTCDSRPEMDRLVADAHQQRFNRILVPKVDRIGRTARAAYQWAWDMADLGIAFIAVSEGIDTSTEVGWARFMEYVTFSELEWLRIKERTVAGRELKISYGGWPGGPAPYGYRIRDETVRIDGRKKKISVLVTDACEARVLSVAVSLLVDLGMNFTEAAEELNTRGLFTRSGVPWTVANLRNRLHSETIHDGYVVYRKTYRGGGKNSTRLREDGTPVHGEPVRIGVPPIFGEQRAGLLMAALKKIGFQNGRHSNRPYPLSGCIKGMCGEVYTGAGGGGTGGARVYRCKGSIKGAASCGETPFDADEIEQAVLDELTRLMKSGGALRVPAAERPSSLSGDRKKYEQRVVELGEKVAAQEDLINRQVPEYLRAGVDARILKASVERLQEELESMRKQKSIAEHWLETYVLHERRSSSLTGAGGVQAGMSLEERQQLFALFRIEVRLDAREHRLKPGVKCEVGEWHWKTGTLVPPDPTDVEWQAVLETLRPHLSKKHFASKYDIRLQFCGMLHRLRHGLTWGNMPLTWGVVDPIRTRQLKWWRTGLWPDVMSTLHASTRGVPAYRLPVLPPLVIEVQRRFGAGTELP
ncbi:recombinase family protein [Streptomyces sp. NPDC058657]|uniref:recombinase family protein n=1 Tax=unclassified Streptomyces TaxID=2593676 RepID=UPI0036668D86